MGAAPNEERAFRSGSAGQVLASVYIDLVCILSPVVRADPIGKIGSERASGAAFAAH